VSPQVIPLYDGVGFPDQPYQYSGQSSQTNIQPSLASQVVSKSELADRTITLQSTESSPQVKITFGRGAITLPSTASEVTLSALPQAPTAQPTSGTIVGNVYLVSASSHPESPQIAVGQAKIFLRLPQGVLFKSPPVVIHRTSSGKWRLLPTEQTGADIYLAPLNEIGEYALAINASSTDNPASSRSTSHQPMAPAPNWGILGVLIGLLAAALLGLRLWNLRTHGPFPKK
jgi:hypothetical protein